MALRIMGVFRWRYRQTDSGHCRRLTLASKVNALGGFLCICLPSVAQAEVQEYDRASTWESTARWHPKATAQDGSNPWKRIHGIVMGLKVPWRQRFNQEEGKK
ncbi:unnamed protein product [Leuciscus chuanchicus]